MAERDSLVEGQTNEVPERVTHCRDRGPILVEPHFWVFNPPVAARIDALQDGPIQGIEAV